MSNSLPFIGQFYILSGRTRGLKNEELAQCGESARDREMQSVPERKEMQKEAEVTATLD